MRSSKRQILPYNLVTLPYEQMTVHTAPGAYSEIYYIVVWHDPDGILDSMYFRCSVLAVIDWDTFTLKMTSLDLMVAHYVHDYLLTAYEGTIHAKSNRKVEGTE